MKPNHFTILFLIFLSLTICSCGPGKPRPGMPVDQDAAAENFSRAETYFESQNFIRAHKYYKRYLEFSPDGDKAPTAIFKIGMIESSFKNYEKARTAFQNLIDTYPESYFIPDAIIEILLTYYKQKNYGAVIDYAQIYESSLTEKYLLRLSVILGDTYLAVDQPREAVFAYLKAKTIPHSEEEKKLSSKIYAAVKRLNTSDIISVLPYIQDDRALSLLMFRLGTNYADLGNTEDAIKILAGFIGKFPDHDKVQEAKELIDELNTRSQYPEFIMGCLLPLSGAYQAIGKKALNGIELALKQVKDLRTQTQIRVIIKDTASDNTTAQNAIQELYDEGALAIIGPVTTAEAAAEKAQELGIPIILFSQKKGLTETGEFVFRNFLTPEMQVKTLANYVFYELGLSRFAILYPDEKYGTTFMNLFWDEIIKYGGTVTGVEPYKTDNTDFSTPIKKLTGLYYEVPDEILTPEELMQKSNRENEDPEASVKAGLIAPQLTYHDIVDVTLLGTNLWHSQQMIDMAKKEIQGAVIPEGFFAESKKPHVRSFVKSYQEAFNTIPGFIEGVSYDTACILFRIAGSSNAHIRAGVRQELSWTNNFPGVTGLTTFDDTGEAQKHLYLLRIKGKKFEEIEYDSSVREPAFPDAFTGAP